MNNSPFILSGIVAVIYMLFRFLEMRFILKEAKPLKILFRDGLLVFISVFLGNFVLKQLLSLNGKVNGKSLDVFTNDPDF
jgi:hypothetical protein